MKPLMLIAIFAVVPVAVEANIPFYPLLGQTNIPVWYDNDEVDDVYTDEMLHVLHATGHIDIRGLSTTYPEDARGWDNGKLVGIDRFHADRLHVADLAADALKDSIPKRIMHRGTVGPFVQPRGRNLKVKIRRTKPIGSAGAHALVQEVLNGDYSAERPLLIHTGGPMTTVADAWLIARSMKKEKDFAERVVVASVLTGRLSAWNTHIDYWAALICTHELRIVLSGPQRGHVVRGITDDWLKANVPPSRFRINLTHHKFDGNAAETPLNGLDKDGGPLAHMLTGQFYTRLQRMSVSGLSEPLEHPNMVHTHHTIELKPSNTGNVMLALQTNPAPATQLWKAVLSNPDIWRQP